MLLYHGTPKSKGNSIIKERKISKSAPALFDNMAFDFCNTTTGYIYLSDGFFTALHWGDIHATNMKEDGFYIFRVDIDEELLLPDLDEKKIDDMFGRRVSICNGLESLKQFRSARVDFDITFDKFVIDYTFFSYNNLIGEFRGLWNEEKNIKDIILTKDQLNEYNSVKWISV